jgi:hypothetical protein
MKTQSNDQIQPIQSIGDGKYYIHTNIVQKVREEDGSLYWEADTVLVTDLNYDCIVAAIIGSSYTIDQEIALINNYLASSLNNESPEGIEYAAYQQCRNDAKEAAMDVLGL